jgi:Ca2+-binding EF-hand superfamily protein
MLVFAVAFNATAVESVKRSIDLDGDGKIDHGELKRAIQMILLEKGEKGIKLEKEERANLAELHDRLDRDKDGLADPSQVRVILKRLREHHPRVFAHLKAKLKELGDTQYTKKNEAGIDKETTVVPPSKSGH